MPKRCQLGQCNVDQLVRFALQGKRVRRFILEAAEIELRNQLAGDAIPMLKARRDQALRDRLIRNAQGGEHFQRRSMRRRGARLFVIDRIGFEQRHLDALLRQGQRCHGADRARAYD